MSAFFYVHGRTVCRNCRERCCDDVHGRTVCRNCRGDNGLSKCQQFGISPLSRLRLWRRPDGCCDDVAAILGAHPLGQCFALLKIDPDNFLVCNVTMHTELQDDLVTALEAFLLSRQGEISEQELLHQLKAFFPQPRTLAVDSLLFQQHFILYHHLFVLQAQWQQEQVALLHIGYAKVMVYTVTALPDNALALWQEQQNKAAYYLDWQNMRVMTDDKLQAVLDEFWKKLALYQQNKALDTGLLQQKWQLTQPYSVAQLKKVYRQQALRLHPDKGGDAADFQLLQQEYQWLLAELSS